MCAVSALCIYLKKQHIRCIHRPQKTVLKHSQTNTNCNTGNKVLQFRTRNWLELYNNMPVKVQCLSWERQEKIDHPLCDHLAFDLWNHQLLVFRKLASLNSAKGCQFSSQASSLFEAVSAWSPRFFCDWSVNEKKFCLP